MSVDDAIDVRQALAASGIMLPPTRRTLVRDTSRSNSVGAVRNLIQQMFAPGKKIWFAGQADYVIDGPTLKFYDGMVIEGEDPSATIKLAGNMNTALFGNFDTVNGNRGVTFRNLTLDQQGDLQSAGGALSCIGMEDCIFENVIFKKSNTFNLFIGSRPGTAISGTLTFTNNTDVVTGSGTAFLTEVAVGDILKTPASHFIRVRAIVNDASLRVDRAWGWPTETGVVTNKVAANRRNTFINCRFEGNNNNDNCGLGLLDDSTFINCESYGATGYGFGPDHTNRIQFIGCNSHDNSNAGIGFETCGFSKVLGGNYYRNSNGIYLLSGAYRNELVGINAYMNVNGVNVSYNSTSFPTPDGNSVQGGTFYTNSNHGVRVGGGMRTIINGVRAFDNSFNGVVLTSENSRNPDYNTIVNSQMGDLQNTIVQDRGIQIAAGTKNLVANNIALDAQHTIAGIVDSGTGTVLANNITA